MLPRSERRYTGTPHDGDDSDDEEAAAKATRYTVIENDWRGGRIVQPIQEVEYEGGVASRRGGKWGQIRGAIGKVGRR